MTTNDRMIAEIEAYLTLPLKNAESFWENEERRSLRGLLEELKDRQREKGNGR